MQTVSKDWFSLDIVDHLSRVHLVTFVQPSDSKMPVLYSQPRLKRAKQIDMHLGHQGNLANHRMLRKLRLQVVDVIVVVRQECEYRKYCNGRQCTGELPSHMRCDIG